MSSTNIGVHNVVKLEFRKQTIRKGLPQEFHTIDILAIDHNGDRVEFRVFTDDASLHPVEVFEVDEVQA